MGNKHSNNQAKKALGKIDKAIGKKAHNVVANAVRVTTGPAQIGIHNIQNHGHPFYRGRHGLLRGRLGGHRGNLGRVVKGASVRGLHEINKLDKRSHGALGLTQTVAGLVAPEVGLARAAGMLTNDLIQNKGKLRDATLLNVANTALPMGILGKADNVNDILEATTGKRAGALDTVDNLEKKGLKRGRKPTAKVGKKVVKRARKRSRRSRKKAVSFA